MKYKPQGMVKWYDPRQLSATGLKTVLSSIFGNFADKREVQAALESGHNEKPYHDYSNQKDIWIDYAADVGDGFDSTHTVAWLMARDELKVKEGADEKEVVLKRGQLLILGGDQVYPTPERDEYEQRFKLPYASAYANAPKGSTDLFAVPGNHDWYDGLTNFLKVFCQERTIGNLQTRQHRSYYALKLPHNVWVWGIDVALSADIDKPQRDYFEEIAREHMQNGDKVILCAPEPAWVYQEQQAKNESFDRLNYFVNRFITHGDCAKGFTDTNLRLLAVIAGDLHHYSHYEGNGPKDVKTGKVEPYHCFTAGGGGAFLTLTHNLPEKILDVWYGVGNVKPGQELTREKTNVLKATYPTKKRSRIMQSRNLLFPFINWEFTIFMASFQLILLWFIQSTTRFQGELTYFDKISISNSLSDLLFVTFSTLRYNPILFMIVLLIPIGFAMFSDTNLKRSWYGPRIAGFVHGALQICTFLVLTMVFVRFNHYILGRYELKLHDELQFSILMLLEMVFIGGLISSFYMGFYLMFSSLILGNHDTEASSSFVCRDFKNFIRIHVTEDKVSIYPIGVENICRHWDKVKKDSHEVPEWQPIGDAPLAHLIVEKDEKGNEIPKCIEIPI